MSSFQKVLRCVGPKVRYCRKLLLNYANEGKFSIFLTMNWFPRTSNSEGRRANKNRKSLKQLLKINIFLNYFS